MSLGSLGSLGSASGGASSIYEQAPVWLDFLSNSGRVLGVGGTAMSKVTHTRASAGTAAKLDGTWVSFASGAPRITDKGFLIERARTNGIRNNTLVGAVTGSPGTLPTNWFGATTGGTLTRTIVGVGVDAGIDYIDIRYKSTSGQAGGIGVQFEGGANVPALTGQTWTATVFWKLVAGNWNNVSNTFISIGEANAAGTYLDGNGSSTYPSNRWIRAQHTRVLNQATTAWVIPAVNFDIVDGPVNFTIRLGWPQLEMGTSITSPIKTSGAAVTRPADIVSVNNFATWYNGPASTVLMDVIRDYEFYATGPADYSVLFTILNSPGPGDEWGVGIDFFNDGDIWAYGTTGGTTTTTIDTWPIAITRPIRYVFGMALNNSNAFVNGMKAFYNAPDLSSPIPTLQNKMAVGSDSQGGGGLDGYVRYIAYWGSRLSDLDMQAISSLNDKSMGILDKASMYIDFGKNESRIANVYSDATSILNFTRNTVGWAQNKAGMWSMFGVGVPRITDKGFLCESPRTNMIRNNSMQGAVPGSPGTLPTNWNIWNTAPLTRTVVGVGTENGIDYIDVRYVGTTVGSIDITIHPQVTTSFAIPAAKDEPWAASAWFKLVAGTNPFSLTVLYALGLTVADAQSDVGQYAGTLSPFFTRWTAYAMFLNPTTTKAMFSTIFRIPASTVCDFTLRIGWPQLENVGNWGSASSTPIRTTNAIGVRDPDLATIPITSAWYNKAEGSLWAEAAAPTAYSLNMYGEPVGLYDQVGMENVIAIEVTTDWGAAYTWVDGSVQAETGAEWILPTACETRQACAWRDGDFEWCGNGEFGLPVPSEIHAGAPKKVPQKVDVVWFGSDNPWAFNNYVERVAYWPRRISNEELRQVTE